MDDVVRTGPDQRRRLTAAERRSQLLDVALELVREHGTDALTLGRLAERAGVSKPVVYDHFSSRPALLMALYRQLDDLQMGAFRSALGRRQLTLAEACGVLAAAYVDCATSTQGDFVAVGAALVGTKEHAVVTQQLLEGYERVFLEVLTAHGATDGVEPDEARRRCTGLVGAAEALSAAAVNGRVDTATAVLSLTALIRGAFPGPLPVT